MFTIKRCLVIPAALVAMIAMSSFAAAQCNSCSGGTAGFGYPQDGCQNCAGGQLGGGALFQGVRNDIDQYKANAALNAARGEAWPLPFSCWDKEVYNSIFNQQFAHGLQAAHILTSEHFHSETNALNRAGEAKVAAIMQNSSAANKKIFVYEDKSAPTLDQRMASIRNMTDRYYAHLGNVQIAKSQIYPNRIPSIYQERYGKTYAEAQAAPVIPVSSGGSISSTVGN